MTPSAEYLLPRDVSLFLGQLLAVLIVLAAMWAAKRWGGAADRDYRDDRPTPGHVQGHGAPARPTVAPNQDVAPGAFRLPIAGLHNARDTRRSD